MGSRAHAAVLAVVALALQAGSSGYVAACPMKASTMTMSASHACCQAARACHGMKKSPLKACCFLGVMSPCADGVVSEARLTAPTATAAVVASATSLPVWAELAAPPSTAGPPILEAPPHRSSILLI